MAQRENKYPIYVISKGRARSRYTVRALETMGADYRVVVEPQERDEYAEVIDPSRILVLPFSNLGQGSIPARNWVWEHSLQEGHARHWILDDNIKEFRRLYRNRRLKVETPAFFRAMEDFVDRYENVALAGPNYVMFADSRTPWAPFRMNTRVYSCILIKNDLPYRWRGRYNEDTDLSLRCLKAGYATVLFNAFLCQKSATMTLKGGNTEELYKREAGFDGRLEMAWSLYVQHPDVTTISRKFGRWQHHVDYRRFKDNPLVPKVGFRVPLEPDEYGMEITEKDGRMQRLPRSKKEKEASK
jgi:hypothetical protein